MTLLVIWVTEKHPFGGLPGGSGPSGDILSAKSGNLFWMVGGKPRL